MLQILKHVFTLSIKLLPPDDGDSLEYHKVQRSLNLKTSKMSAMAAMSQSPSDHDFSYQSSYEKMTPESTPSFSAPQGCMNTHL